LALALGFGLGLGRDGVRTGGATGAAGAAAAMSRIASPGPGIMGCISPFIRSIAFLRQGR
jgi:hypothetical protein